MRKNPLNAHINRVKQDDFLLNIHRNIKEILTSQHKADYALIDIVNYYNDIILCMPGNVYWLDSNCLTIGCNQNVLDMFGLKTIDQFLGLSFDDMAVIGGWDRNQADSFKRDTLEVLNTGKAKRNIEEPPIPGVNGEMIYFLTTRVPLFDAQKKVIGIVGISTDITQRKKMEKDLLVSKEAAEAANRAKTEFLANISHDMKTPLAGIVTTAEVIAGDEHSSERDRQYASIISDSGKQLAKFFTSCLDLSKLEMQEWSSKNETFSIQTLLQDIQALFAPQALAKNLLFTVESDHTLPKSVEGHRDSLYRILLNLTGNALKFTEQGKITLRALRVSAPDDQHVKVAFQVQDTGVGIPEDKYHVIFEKFRRLEPSYKNNIEGSGVGLYIVDQFIKRMNGAIDVKSKVGDGSVFTATVILKIPASDVLSLSEKSSTFSLKHKHADELPHVLLVEDTEMIQFITKSLLIDAGFSVDVANSGEEALEKFLPEKYDLIYMDIGLPGMDGYQMTRAIRAQEKKYQAAHNIPIIALTGHGAIDVQEFCGEAGMQGVLSKPLTREQAEKVWQRFGENESIIVPGLTDLVAQQATTEENAILDISATIKIVGIKDIAEKMVTDFIKDLQGNFLPEIKTLILQRKDEELRFLLHRQLGSLAYVKAPQLHQRLLTLQKAAHDGGAYSEKDYEEIEQEVLRVVDCCQRMSK